MSDIIESDELDHDTCTDVELNKMFANKMKLHSTKAVSLDKSYINKMSSSKSMQIFLALSDNTLEVYSIDNQLNRLSALSGHSAAVTDVRSDPANENLLYSSALDGIIKKWDLRTGQTCVREFKESSPNKDVKPLASMDVSCNGKLLCAGTELTGADAFILFWDCRASEPLGGYWNAHTDDVSQVMFHSDSPDQLATGSLDGLINVFDLKQQNEDDALTYSLNVENSVEKISWVGDERLSCVTQSNDVQIWDARTGDQTSCFDREAIAQGIKRSLAEDCYSVDVFDTSDDRILLLAGSNAGNGECLRTVQVDEGELTPSTNFEGNKQIIRCSCYFKEREMLVTGGESGVLSVWLPGQECVAPPARNTSAITTARRHQRTRPY